jgi:hypothetical protein
VQPARAPVDGRPNICQPSLPLQIGMGGGMKVGINVWRALNNNASIHPAWVHLASNPLTEADLPRSIEPVGEQTQLTWQQERQHQRRPSHSQVGAGGWLPAYTGVWSRGPMCRAMQCCLPTVGRSRICWLFKQAAEENVLAVAMPFTAWHKADASLHSAYAAISTCAIAATPWWWFAAHSVPCKGQWALPVTCCQFW